MEVNQPSRNLLLFEGIIFTLLGVLAVAMPGISTLSTELFIGWLMLFGGLVLGYRAFKSWGSSTSGFIWTLLLALLYIIVGIMLLVNPLAGVITLTLVLTAFFIIEGIAKIILGFQLRPANQWGWFILNGIIALAMAYIIYAGWPGTAFWVLGLLVGINMIFLGIALIFWALNIPKTTNNPPQA